MVTRSAFGLLFCQHSICVTENDIGPCKSIMFEIHSGLCNHGVIFLLFKILYIIFWRSINRQTVVDAKKVKFRVNISVIVKAL